MSSIKKRQLVKKHTIFLKKNFFVITVPSTATGHHTAYTTGISASIHCSLVTHLPWVPWELRPAEPSSASRESLGFLT